MNNILTVEAGLLGSLIVRPEKLLDIDLLPGEFLSSIHAQVYSTILELDKANETIDIVTIDNYLTTSTGRDWMHKLGELVQSKYSHENAAHYARLIRHDANKRAAIAISEDLIKNVTQDSQEAINAAIRDLMAINASKVDYSCTIRQALTSTIDYMQKVLDGDMHGVSTGLAQIDKCLGGFQKTDLYVIGARPAMGKTALLLNLASNCGKPCGIISGEQPREQIGLRMIAINGRISAYNLRNADLEEFQWAKTTRTAAEMMNKKIWIYDKPAPTINDIIREARKWKFQNNIHALYVDYLQKILGSRKDMPKLERIEEVASSLKNLARELDIPVIALAQVARAVEQRPNKRPYMSDMADSSSIEKEADNIMTLYRDDVYNEDSQYKGQAELCVLKNRHGPTGTFILNWKKEFMIFDEEGINYAGKDQSNVHHIAEV